jgi:hypothetical protein
MAVVGKVSHYKITVSSQFHCVPEFAPCPINWRCLVAIKVNSRHKAWPSHFVAKPCSYSFARDSIECATFLWRDTTAVQESLCCVALLFLPLQDFVTKWSPGTRRWQTERKVSNEVSDLRVDGRDDKKPKCLSNQPRKGTETRSSHRLSCLCIVVEPDPGQMDIAQGQLPRTGRTPDTPSSSGVRWLINHGMGSECGGGGQRCRNPF